MVQEIITYMIIGSAVLIAVLRTIKRFRKRKRKPTVDFKNNKFEMHHNCSDCSAECMLRDSLPQIRKENEKICTQTKVKR